MNASHLRATTLLCLLGAAACSQPKPTTKGATHPDSNHAVANAGVLAAKHGAAASGSHTTARAHANPRSPLHVALRGPDRVPKTGEMTLTLDITRVSAAMVPIGVRLVLPAGVRLLSGKADDKITEKSSLELLRTWRLSYAKLPLKDATVVVDWQTSGGGFHAELPWRFGRAAPQRRKLIRLPEARTPGGLSLGRPILTGGGAAKKTGK